MEAKFLDSQLPILVVVVIYDWNIIFIFIFD